MVDTLGRTCPAIASFRRLLLCTCGNKRAPAIPNTADAKARLKVQLAELEERQDRIGRNLAEPLNPDSSERAVEMEDDVSLQAQAALVAREIASVRRALTRIENGNYGECVRCGSDIASKRLETRPEAALCFECASKEQ
jgi:RNA polymerase-binding transcription factor DksA